MNCAHPGILRFCIKRQQVANQNHSALGSPRHHNISTSRTMEMLGSPLGKIYFYNLFVQNKIVKSNAFKNGIFKMVILVTFVKVFFLLSLFVDN